MTHRLPLWARGQQRLPTGWLEGQWEECGTIAEKGFSNEAPPRPPLSPDAWCTFVVEGGLASLSGKLSYV